jgi:hypothetical protein
MSARGVTPEKEWLDAAILNFIERRSPGMVGVYEDRIFDEFAPTNSLFREAALRSENSVFGARPRRVQKAMIAASISRLVACGKIGSVKFDWRKNGQVMRLYRLITVLDALAGL